MHSNAEMEIYRGADVLSTLVPLRPSQFIVEINQAASNEVVTYSALKGRG